MIDYARHTVPRIKAELKIRGLSRTGKKADLVDRLHTAIKKESFFQFSKLPLEIRREIWAHSFPRRRIVDLQTRTNDEAEGWPKRPGLPAAMSIMLTCKESYDVAFKRYKLVENPRWQRYDRYGPFEKVNYHDDVFYLDIGIVTVFSIVKLPGSFMPTTTLIKSVALPAHWFSDCFRPRIPAIGGIKNFLGMKSLEEIIIIEDVRPSARKREAWEGARAPRPELEYYNEDPEDPALIPSLQEWKTTVANDPKLKPLEHVKIFFSQWR